MLSKTPVENATLLQKNPIAVIGVIVAIVQFVISQWGEVSVFLLSLGLSPETVTLIETILTLIATLAGVYFGRKFVTPLSSPRNQAGEALTPE